MKKTLLALSLGLILCAPARASEALDTLNTTVSNFNQALSNYAQGMKKVRDAMTEKDMETLTTETVTLGKTDYPVGMVINQVADLLEVVHEALAPVAEKLPTLNK